MKENTAIIYRGIEIYHNAFGEFNLCSPGSDSMFTPTKDYSFKTLREAKEKVRDITKTIIDLSNLEEKQNQDINLAVNQSVMSLNKVIGAKL